MSAHTWQRKRGGNTITLGKLSPTTSRWEYMYAYMSYMHLLHLCICHIYSWCIRLITSGSLYHSLLDSWCIRINNLLKSILLYIAIPSLVTISHQQHPPLPLHHSIWYPQQPKVIIRVIRSQTTSTVVYKLHEYHTEDCILPCVSFSFPHTYIPTVKTVYYDSTLLS